MRTLLIFLFVAIVTLLVYNPTMDDFKDHIEAETRQRERELSMNNMVGRMLTGEQVNMNTSLMVSSTERNNYLILSTYKVSLPDADEALREWKYLGVGGFFFEMEAPAAVDLHATPGG
ncbi:MAG: hypothetical protein SH809_20640 [Rhodothermales bacterium]|nr:hypothetical protein [Rhodothermales bacterium]